MKYLNDVKNSIGWADYTWNPITGCLHTKKECPIRDKCYAVEMAKRFNKSFESQFHPERLNVRFDKLQAGTRIFVGSNGDMWGDWVSHEWIDKVIFKTHYYINPKLKELGICEEQPLWDRVTFQFLTKNPKRYIEIENGFESFCEEESPKGYYSQWIKNNCWLGFTDLGQINVSDIEKLRETFPDHILFVSFEPFMGWRKEIVDLVDWVIIGGWSGNNYGIYQTKYFYFTLHQGEIVQTVEYCKKQNKPVYIKDNITKHFPSAFYTKLFNLKQFPEAKNDI